MGSEMCIRDRSLRVKKDLYFKELVAENESGRIKIDLNNKLVSYSIVGLGNLRKESIDDAIKVLHEHIENLKELKEWLERLS